MKDIITYTLIVAALGLASITFFSQKKVGFFDYNMVYNTCDLKIELETDLKKVGSARESELDSLSMELSFISQSITTSEPNEQDLASFENLKVRYLTLKQKYEEEGVHLKETYFSQIRGEINDKARMFAEANGFDYLFAAVGDGSLMYGDESYDATEEFKSYLNK